MPVLGLCWQRAIGDRARSAQFSLRDVRLGARHPRALGISPRTIEDHRANIMKKLGARNAADLIRIVMTVQRN